MPTVINPYTFIPFGNEPARTDIATTYADPSGLLTGWIDVQLQNKTGLIVPGKIVGKKDEHKTLPFFRTPDHKIAIPGSELRGMLRSEYEAITNSCLLFLKDDKKVSMRVPPEASLENQGLLVFEDHKWSLWSANVWHQQVDDWSTIDYGWKGKLPGDEVSFVVLEKHQAELNDDDSQTGAQTGIIQFMKPVAIPKDKFYHVSFLQKKELLKDYSNDDTIYEALLEELEKHGNGKDLNPLRRKLREHAVKVKQNGQGAIPIWYVGVTVGEETRYYISPSSIGRVNQVRTWKEIMGKYNPCEASECSCPACQLFGTVWNKKQIRGRIRFSDAKPCENIDHLPWVMLPILGEPKPTAFNFYINRPHDAGAIFWNYDFYANNAPDDQNERYFGREDFTARGRKFYFHGMEQVGDQRTKLNATAEVLKREQDGEFVPFNFTFRLYFDQITKKQLEQLKWLLTLGENKQDSLLQHKLGHGRPIGYGSVKMTIEGITFRKLKLVDGALSYTMETEKTIDIVKTDKELQELFDEKALKRFKRICDWNTVSGAYVQYPNGSTSKGPQIYKWFADNPQKILPLVSNGNADITLTTSEILYQLKPAPEIRRIETMATGTVGKVLPKKSICFVKVMNLEYTVTVVNGNMPRVNSIITFEITDEKNRKGRFGQS